LRIHVPAGTRMLMLSGISEFTSEYEFLLGHKMQFFITKSGTEVFCKDTYDFKMRVTDMTVL
jgi:hypothetical protein